jgi:hypothetical protein
MHQGYFDGIARPFHQTFSSSSTEAPWITTTSNRTRHRRDDCHMQNVKVYIRNCQQAVICMAMSSNARKVIALGISVWNIGSSS